MGYKVIPGVTDLLTYINKRPELKYLIDEFLGKDEHGNTIEMCNLHSGSSKKVLWKCKKCKYEWLDSVSHRSKYFRGCPKCSHKIVSEVNSLDTWCNNNGNFGNIIRNEWYGELEDGTKLEIHEIAYASRKKVKWMCSKNKNHIFTMKVQDRTSNKSMCPYCINRKIDNDNSLLHWCNENGEFGYNLAKEWTNEDEQGNNINITEIGSGSHVRVKWKCTRGHVWSTTIRDRTIYKTGCPKCTLKGTSYPEQYLYHALKQIYYNAENRLKAFKDELGLRGLELDIAIDVREEGFEYNGLAIEYSPTYWHDRDNTIKIDELKRQYCNKYNIRMITIKEDSYNELKHEMTRDYICFYKDKRRVDEQLNQILAFILKTINHDISEIDIEKVKRDTLSKIVELKNN